MTCFAHRIAVLILAVSPIAVLAEEFPRPEPIGEPATKVYRLVFPDGRIMYSDKPMKGARIDETIAPDREMSTWTTETGKRPVIPPKVERTPVSRVPSALQPDRPKTLDEANADVIRAEMLLDDARKQQQAGIEPQPGERTGIVSSGRTRLNQQYWERQHMLADEVSQAEAELRKSRAERDALRR